MFDKLTLAVTILLLMAPSTMRAAGEGAALYKAKCSGCHGVSGEGKAAIKAPALKGSAMDADQITEHILKGGPQSKAPHNKGISGVNEGQAKAIAEYIKALK